MNKQQLLMIMALGILFTAAPAQAQTPEEPEHKGSMMQQEKETGPVEVGNKICPVSGEKVGQMGETVKVEYNGKIYNLCCDMCKKDFLKNPEKYRKIAEEDAKKYQEAAGEDHQGDRGEENEQHNEHDHGHDK